MKRPWNKHRHEHWWKAYSQQRGNADLRGIEWKIEPLEWWMLWQTSGKWEQRGRRLHQYCMARFNDSGPYAIDNVMIITNVENHEMQTPVKHTEEHKQAMSKRLKGKKFTGRSPIPGEIVMTTERKKQISETFRMLWKDNTYREKTLNSQRKGKQRAYLQGRALKTLTVQQVREIRSLARSKTQREIAKQFNITQGTVSLILNRQSFSWLK